MAGLVPTDCCNIKHHIGRVGVTSEAFNTSKSYGSPKNHNNQRDLRICQKVPSQNPQRDTQCLAMPFFFKRCVWKVEKSLIKWNPPSGDASVAMPFYGKPTAVNTFSSRYLNLLLECNHQSTTLGKL